jgi:hypothetical protein
MNAVSKPTTVVAVSDLEAAVAIQCEWLMKQARRAAQHGYYLSITGLNKYMEAAELQFPFSYIGGGMSQLIDAWNAENKTRILKVVVSPKDTELMLRGPLVFSCDIPKRAWSREIIAALQLISAFKKHIPWKERTGPSPTYQGAGLLKVEERSDLYVVRGESSDALQGFLRILEMPQHKKLLTGHS